MFDMFKFLRFFGSISWIFRLFLGTIFLKHDVRSCFGGDASRTNPAAFRGADSQSASTPQIPAKILLVLTLSY